MQKIKIEKKIHKFFLEAHILIFEQKLFIMFFHYMIALPKFHFHIHYKEVYLYKKFQNFSIKIITTIAYSKCLFKKIGTSSKGSKHVKDLG